MPQRATRRGASRVAAIMTSATVEKAALKAIGPAAPMSTRGEVEKNTKRRPSPR